MHLLYATLLNCLVLVLSAITPPRIYYGGWRPILPGEPFYFGPRTPRYYSGSNNLIHDSHAVIIQDGLHGGYAFLEDKQPRQPKTTAGVYYAPASHQKAPQQIDYKPVYIELPRKPLDIFESPMVRPPHSVAQHQYGQLPYTETGSRGMTGLYEQTFVSLGMDENGHHHHHHRHHHPLLRDTASVKPQYIPLTKDKGYNFVETPSPRRPNVIGQSGKVAGYPAGQPEVPFLQYKKHFIAEPVAPHILPEPHSNVHGPHYAPPAAHVYHPEHPGQILQAKLQHSSRGQKSNQLPERVTFPGPATPKPFIPELPRQHLHKPAQVPARHTPPQIRHVQPVYKYPSHHSTQSFSKAPETNYVHQYSNEHNQQQHAIPVNVGHYTVVENSGGPEENSGQKHVNNQNVYYSNDVHYSGPVSYPQSKVQEKQFSKAPYASSKKFAGMVGNDYTVVQVPAAGAYAQSNGLQESHTTEPPFYTDYHGPHFHHDNASHEVRRYPSFISGPPGDEDLPAEGQREQTQFDDEEQEENYVYHKPIAAKQGSDSPNESAGNSNGQQIFHAYYAPADHVPPEGYVRMSIKDFDKLFRNAEIRYIDQEPDFRRLKNGDGEQNVK